MTFPFKRCPWKPGNSRCSWATRVFAPFPFPFRVFAPPGTLQLKGAYSMVCWKWPYLVVVETFTNRGGRFTSRVQGLHWTAAMQNHGRRRRPTKLLPSLEVIQVAASSICRCPTPSTFLDSLDSTQKWKKSGANLLNLPHAIRKKNNEIGAACMYFPLPCTWLCLSMTFPNREVCLRGIIRRSVSGVRFGVCFSPQVEKQNEGSVLGYVLPQSNFPALTKNTTNLHIAVLYELQVQPLGCVPT